MQCQICNHLRWSCRFKQKACRNQVQLGGSERKWNEQSTKFWRLAPFQLTNIIFSCKYDFRLLMIWLTIYLLCQFCRNARYCMPGHVLCDSNEFHSLFIKINLLLSSDYASIRCKSVCLVNSWLKLVLIPFLQQQHFLTNKFNKWTSLYVDSSKANNCLYSTV